MNAVAVASSGTAARLIVVFCAALLRARVGYFSGSFSSVALRAICDGLRGSETFVQCALPTNVAIRGRYRLGVDVAIPVKNVVARQKLNSLSSGGAGRAVQLDTDHMLCSLSV